MKKSSREMNSLVIVFIGVGILPTFAFAGPQDTYATLKSHLASYWRAKTINTSQVSLDIAKIRCESFPASRTVENDLREVFFGPRSDVNQRKIDSIISEINMRRRI